MSNSKEAALLLLTLVFNLVQLLACSLLLEMHKQALPTINGLQSGERYSLLAGEHALHIRMLRELNEIEQAAEFTVRCFFDQPRGGGTGRQQSLSGLLRGLNPLREYQIRSLIDRQRMDLLQRALEQDRASMFGIERVSDGQLVAFAEVFRQRFDFDKNRFLSWEINAAVDERRETSDDFAVKTANLCVLAAYRRAGLGSLLLGLCEQQSLQWGFPSMLLMVEASNSPARVFYSRQGYSEINYDPSFRQYVVGGPVLSSKRSPALLMQKTLIDDSALPAA